MQSHIGGLIQFAAQDTMKATFTGSIYRKQLAKYGEWVNPEYPYLSSDPIMTLDETWGNKIVENFNNNVLGSPVPVPLNHTSNVEANTGRVQSLESIPGDGLYGNLLITDEVTEKKLDKGEIFDVSISFDWDHKRTDDNKSYGATLLHVALVNNPYLIEMNTFEKVGPALSKLDEDFKSVGLAHASANVILLSKDKMKELSKMATKTIKNEKDFAVAVAFKDGDATQEAILQPGEEITVEEEVAETVAAQIEEAVEPTSDDSEGEAEDGVEGDVEGEADNSEAEGEGDVEDEKTELARLRLENAELQLSKDFDALLAEGKVIPAQKEKIIALAKLSQGVQLSKDAGTKTDVASVVLDILRIGKQQFSTDESGSSKEDENATSENETQNNEGKKPSETLTEDELAGFKAVGADPSKMDELAEKDPVYAAALASLSKTKLKG